MLQSILAFFFNIWALILLALLGYVGYKRYRKYLIRKSAKRDND
ncbi:MAG: hypothetical protein H6Q14_670 [Bacteroidetes bacterium]|nr:hypothetical protein [Bacteroidota bacterium]